MNAGILSVLGYQYIVCCNMQQHPGARGGKSSGPPPGYIPGIGRGAVGFTTRSDVGNAAATPAISDGTLSRSAEARIAKQQEPVQAPQYDQEDDEADAIWDAIDKRMQERKRKKASGDDGKVTSPVENSPTRQIGAEFQDLKQQLSTVTEDQWASIPDVGDYSLKYKQKRRQQDTITGPSDSLLEQRHQTNLGANTKVAGTAVDGTNTETVMNLSGLSAARGTVLGMSLDKQENASGIKSTAVDATGYLTSLSSTKIATTSEINDIQKARLLLKSVRDTNPKHGPGWIASARVEEAAGKTLAARKIIQEGCRVCAENEDVWLEAARLHPAQVGKSILASAVRSIPKSVKIFLKAADMEHDRNAKKAVLRKALEANPISVTLWKAAVELENAADARILLGVAVEKVPASVEMWLALARLETYQNAQKVLNKARKALPTDISIWIAAAKLEESQNHDDMVDKVIERAVKSLRKNDAAVSRLQWLQEAEAAEASGAPKTSAAIVKFTIGQDVDDLDRLRTWSEDAKALIQRGSIASARAVLKNARSMFPNKRKIWMLAVELERNHGNAESLDNILESACIALPKIEVFWLLRAKERWMAGEVDQAREILSAAFELNPDSEEVWLAAAKLEWENGETDRARELFRRARDRAPSCRIYIKAAGLEREQGQATSALDLVSQGISRFPKAAKLYMIAGQIASEDLPKVKANLQRARRFYQEGLKHCPHNTVLWTLASRLEEKAPAYDSEADVAAGVTKARSLLEIGRIKNPKNPELWLEAVRLERRNGIQKLADSLMAKALQECPNDGSLLAENIYNSRRVEQKSKSADAIKRCPEDPRVISAVASLFASERKTEKARKWFDRAVLLNPDLGDSWARYYAFELGMNDETRLFAIRKRCVNAEPRHGELWASVRKARDRRNNSTEEILALVAQTIRQHPKQP